MGRDFDLDRALAVMETLTGIPPDILLSRRRDRRTADARMVLSYNAFLATGSLTGTGRLLGCNHSTVWHRVSVVRFALAHPAQWEDIARLHSRFSAEMERQPFINTLKTSYHGT